MYELFQTSGNLKISLKLMELEISEPKKARNRFLSGHFNSNQNNAKLSLVS